MVNTDAKTAFDEKRAKDAATPPWDAFARPHKPLCEYTTDELQQETMNLARVYLMRRGYGIEVTTWQAPGSERTYLVSRDECGVLVLVRVYGRMMAGKQMGAGPYVPEVKPSPERSSLDCDLRLWLRKHEVCEHGVRADVIAIDLIDQRLARLRHLVDACRPSED